MGPFKTYVHTEFDALVSDISAMEGRTKKKWHPRGGEVIDSREVRAPHLTHTASNGRKGSL